MQVFFFFFCGWGVLLSPQDVRPVIDNRTGVRWGTLLWTCQCIAVQSSCTSMCSGVCGLVHLTKWLKAVFLIKMGLNMVMWYLLVSVFCTVCFLIIGPWIINKVEWNCRFEKVFASLKYRQEAICWQDIDIVVLKTSSEYTTSKKTFCRFFLSSCF